jgi:hypothetical protein
MPNQIRDLVVVNHRLDPIETELHLHVKVAELTPSTKVRGRLMGPRCAYSSTIEIAYRMTEVERIDHIVMRVIIPEPSCWHPQTPFLYQGPLELWNNGELCDRVEISHGIRWAQLSSKGLRLNGQPYLLRGRIVEPTWSEADATAMRADGINAIVSTTAPKGMELWDAADRLGFFVLGTTDEYGAFLHWKNELTAHVSSFGWIFQREQLLAEPPRSEGSPLHYGINTSSHHMPANADFLVCSEKELAWLDEVELPKLVVRNAGLSPQPTRPDVFGWIDAATP